MYRLFRCLACWAFCVGCVAPSCAEPPAEPTELPVESLGTRTDQPITKGWQVGLRINAAGGTCHNIVCTVPVPMEWREQAVKIVAQDVSPNIGQVSYRTLENGVRQMLVKIDRLNQGAQAHALVTFEVTTHTILPPKDTSLFKIPDRRQVPKDVQRFLKVGSHVEVKHPLIRKANAESIKDDAPAWEQVKAIYDHVRAQVKYLQGPLKGGVQALRDGHGDCESMTCLFLAMCRAHRVPARMVWVVDHAYPEFYLVDKKGQGYWFPCQVAGTEAFGAMPDARPILQKGEDFVVPEQKGRQHYVSEYLAGTPVRGAKQPTVEFIRQYVDLSASSAEPDPTTAP
ncbi:MAG: transglutaminase-like domain-containing protein [Planctomycetota bacterium]|nr:transglutaminase-like domain-containing protein [Planctomycetota bacterium]MDA1178311.1 transglutaminase-like domain-containing protein [Planctomycetota bacterium]